MYRIYTSSGKLRTISKWDAQSRLIDGTAKVWTSGPSGTVLMPVKGERRSAQFVPVKGK